jgi:ribosomal protein L40E
MSVRDALTKMMRGQSCDSVYAVPDIPSKKLANARSKFVTGAEPIIILIDDTVFGSAKSGLAISEEYIYGRGSLDKNVRVNLTSIRNIRYEKSRLGSFVIYVDDLEFLTLDTLDKYDYDFILSLLQTAVNVAAQNLSRAVKHKSENLTKIDDNKKSVLTVSGIVGTSAAITCAACDADLPANAKFCLDCGAKVTPKGVCRGCNSKLPEIAKFCSECGMSITKSQGVSAAQDPANDGLRAEMCDWLANAKREAFIDTDGDLSYYLRATPPAFAKDYRGWMVRCRITVESEGLSEEKDNDCSSFGPRDEVYLSSPYCRVGQLPSAPYTGNVKCDVFVVKNLEVHEIELKEGRLTAPTLSSSRISIASLTAAKDEDGQYRVSYELSAYPGHVAFFEVSNERAEADSVLFAQVSDSDQQADTNYLWGAYPGQKIFVYFGEYAPLIEGVESTFSGTAMPRGGSHDTQQEMSKNSTYDRCLFLNIAHIEHSEYLSPVGIGNNPLVVLVNENDSKCTGFIGEYISNSKEISGDGLYEVLGEYLDYIKTDFQKIYKSDVDKSFLFEFVVGLHNQDFGDFEYENEGVSFSFYDLNETADFEDSTGSYGFLLASVDAECTYSGKSLKILGEECATAGDCLEICMSNGEQYAAFLD